MRKDRVRLKIIASQIIYEAKKDKYLLSYNNFLVLSILVGLTLTYKSKNIQDIEGQQTFPELRNARLAFKTR